jgi:ribosome-binding protein aMBF1 (putative translation factor)
MKTRHIHGVSKPRIRATGDGADVVRAFITEHMPNARLVGESEAADYVMLKPDDLDELIEDRLAAAAYARTRDQESLPQTTVDRLLAGENPVRVWREHRGLTLADLAAKAGIGKGYLSQIEQRQRNGTVATLQKLAAALGVELDDLTVG